MKPTSIVSIITASSAITVGKGLITKTLPSFTRRRSSSHRPSSTNPSNTLQMYLDGMDESLITSSLLTSIASPLPIHHANNIFSDTSEHITSDPKLEAEILSDVSHVAMDFNTFFFGTTNSAWIRFCNVFGRILIITSDYVPDQYISPDELAFQTAMLTFSTHVFLRSAWPILLASLSTTSLSVRDRRAFTQLFDKVDLSILQFKTLITSKALQWVEAKHGDEIELNGDYIYWLQKGEVMTSSSFQETGVSTSTTGTSIDVDSPSSSSRFSHRIFGELHFAKTLEESRLGEKKTRTSKKSSKVKDDNDSNNSCTTARMNNETLTVGQGGAVLLQISTPKLLKLMKHDDQLCSSMNRLVLSCMQEKLARFSYKVTSNVTA